MDKIYAEELGKIRRFVFQDLKNSGMIDSAYSYWVDLETNLSGDLNSPAIFLLDYLTVQNGGVLTKPENLANDFYKYYLKICKFQAKDIVLKNLCRYSSYYKKITTENITDEDIREKISQINASGAKDAIPFLMEVFEDYDFAHINKRMLLEILSTVLGFINERNSAHPSKLALSFAGLSNEVNKMMVLKDYMPRFVVEHPNSLNKMTINKIR